MKLLIRLVLVTLLLLILAACGGEEEAAVEESSDSAAAEMAAEEDADAAAVDEPGAEAHEADEDEMDHATEDEAEAADHEDEMDADESHETVEDAESDGDDDGDVDEGHDEEAEDGAMEADSVEDDAVAAAPAGDGWGESGTTAQSACDHPYMPLREGATWTYEGADGGLTWEVTSVEGDLEEATAVVLVKVDDVEFEYTWDCAEGSGISSFDFAGQGMTEALPEMTMELLNGEGSFLPPAAEMVPGYAWDANFEQKMSFVIGDGDEQIEATSDIATEQMSTVLSAGPVTAAGVTVDGVQVEQINNIAMVMNMMGSAVEQSQVLSNVFDLGWGIGIMHQAVESEFGPSAMDLVSFYVP